jgi:hypothetical protein
MERQRFVAALVAALSLSFALAEESAAQGPGPGPQGPSRQGMRSFRPAREQWRQMSPEDRQRIRSNAQRWLQLPPEERQQLRLREGMRRQRIQQEARAALQDSGLQLEAEKRDLYERRYMQERRRIERALRQDLQERRQRELAPVVENLKKEFGQPQNPGNVTATSVTPAPKK